MKALILICLTAISLCSCHVRNTEYPKIVTFCRNIDYTDTALLHNDKAMDSLIRDFVRHMKVKGSNPDVIREALEIFLNGIKNDEQTLRSASRHAYLILGNPNSPLRDESGYSLYLEALMNTPGIPEDMAEKAEETLRKTKLNRKGSLANDFRYIDRNGNEGSLHQLKANKLILIFYDPECPHCTELLRKKAASHRVNAAIDSGELTVLAVYAEGKRDVWEKTKDEMPRNWIVTYDLTGVLDNELYDLPAMPIAYYLSSDKHVIIKDVPW